MFALVDHGRRAGLGYHTLIVGLLGGLLQLRDVGIGRQVFGFSCCLGRAISCGRGQAELPLLYSIVMDWPNVFSILVTRRTGSAAPLALVIVAVSPNCQTTPFLK